MPIVLSVGGGAVALEQLLFDPTDELTGTELDVMAAPYGVTAMAFPAPPPDFAWAGSMDTEGDGLAATRHQNRRVTLTVEVVATTQPALDVAVDTLQAKVAKVWAEGGTLRRVRADGTYRTLDLISAEAYEPVFDIKYVLGNLAEVNIGLIAKPYWRGPEVAYSTHSETTLPCLIFSETAIPGDIPGLGRLVIANNVASAQHWIIWGLESRNYSSAATAALFYQAESLTMVSGATGADATASGGSRVRLTTSTSWVTSFKATGRTHIGEFRVIARAKASTFDVVDLRAYWTSLGPEVYAINAAARVGDNWTVYDLGVVQVGRAVPAGQPWTLEIQAKTTTGTPTVDVDWIMLVPVGEASGLATGEPATGFSYAPLGLPAVAASGSFTVRYDAALKGPDGSNQYGPPYRYEGDYLLVPPAGTSGRTLRVVVKMTRGTASNGPTEDPNIDDLAATLTVTPRYLAAP